ncbi:SbmA/BacA-like family transporter [Candidatus Portiera aleyrodidarum]|uniref:SbmA/BacA-like family transporter n=2 Tax=Candidatus Portiera aleyrodidarum TaxID=91844 RepID=UPI0009B6DD36
MHFKNLKNKEFWHLNMQFVFIASFMLLLSIYRYYFTNLLTLRWRIWLTKLNLNLWISSKTVYKLDLNNNTDKRITEDIDR